MELCEAVRSRRGAVIPPREGYELTLHVCVCGCVWVCSRVCVGVFPCVCIFGGTVAQCMTPSPHSNKALNSNHRTYKGNIQSGSRVVDFTHAAVGVFVCPCVSQCRVGPGTVLSTQNPTVPLCYRWDPHTKLTCPHTHLQTHPNPRSFLLCVG